MSKARMALGLTAAIVAALSFGSAGATEPSGTCAGEAVTPVNPTGTIVAAKSNGTNNGGSLQVCNDGTIVGKTVPIPAKGKATVSVSLVSGSENGYIEIDGDSDNDGGGDSCLDGYDRVAGNSDGPAFYDHSGGGYNSAHKTDAQGFAQHNADNCAP
ncbi:MAG: hypothetical protein WDA27_05935 [Actinomycetota bacterium]